MAKQPKILTGQVAAITGGARGIGRAIAQAFLRQGMRVALGDVDRAAVEATAAELGEGVVGLELDVTRRESFEAFLDAVDEQLGPVDVLVNNAGIMPVGPFLDEDDVTAQRILDINVHGVLLGMKVALPRMVARNRGAMVNIASQAGKFGAPGGATYAASKFAVVGVSEAVRGELKHLGASGVSVHCVMPAVVATELGGGLTDTRGVKKLRPDEVADEVVLAIQEDRFDVWVPRSSGRISTVMNLFPRRGREAVGRALKADKVLWDVDTEHRRAYELRAAKSEPALESPATEQQLPERSGAS